MSDAKRPRILAVDLDGTLHDGDLAMTLLVRLLITRPWHIPMVLTQLSRGRLQLKRFLAAKIDVDPATLAWHQSVLDFLRDASDRQRPLILATAAMHSQAELLADYLDREHGIRFWRVLGSDEQINLHGAAKAQALAKLSAGQGFDYIGDSPLQDPPVFAQATVCHFVNPTPAMLRDYQSDASMVFTTQSGLTKRLRRWLLSKVQQKP